MRAAIFAYSRQGCGTARRVMAALPEVEWRSFTVERLAQEGFSPLGRPAAPFYGELFAWAEVMVFIGSCGIAVREIAPHVRDKRTDPAVLCIDERGQFVIPLLSGHIGGANDLARTLAQALGAAAVITTATDINGRFSVDAWAARQGLIIDSMPLCKAVSAAILEGDVPLMSDFPLAADYPSGICEGNAGALGILVSYRTAQPFERTLRLIPSVLHVGIGCRRGTAAETIRRAVDTVLAQNGIDRRAIKCAASIDLKADEAGLLQCCRELSWPLRFYSGDALSAVEGSFTASDFVKTITGVDNVCERAALLGAEKLIVKKTAIEGVTVALAAEKWEVHVG